MHPSRETLNDLLDDLRKITGPDRDIDMRIGRLIGGWVKVGNQVRDNDGFWHSELLGSLYPSATESIGDALSILRIARPEAEWSRANGSMMVGYPGKDPFWGEDSPTDGIGLMVALVKMMLADLG